MLSALYKDDYNILFPFMPDFFGANAFLFILKALPIYCTNSGPMAHIFAVILFILDKFKNLINYISVRIDKYRLSVYNDDIHPAAMPE